MKTLVTILSLFFLLSCSNNETKQPTLESVKIHLPTDSFSIQCIGDRGFVEKIDTMILNDSLLVCKLGVYRNCALNKLDTFFLNQDTLNLEIRPSDGQTLACDCYLKIFVRLNYHNKLPKAIAVNGYPIGSGTGVTFKDDYSSEDSTLIDVSDIKFFWATIVPPILSKDSQAVLLNMDFPVYGDWTHMMQLKKEPIEANRKDFEEIYNKFFNKFFLKELAKQTYKDVDAAIFHDTTWYTIAIGRSFGQYEGSVMLDYYKQGKHYKLKQIHGAGANFFAIDN